jgi:hypothetical protein
MNLPDEVRMKKLSSITSWSLRASLVVFFTTSIEAQVMTNRTTDKAKIQQEIKPQPTPSQNSDEILTPDPRIGPKGKPRPAKTEFKTLVAYYVRLSGVSRVLVSDAKGRTDDLFRAGSLQKVEATYDFLGPDTVFITLPADEAYSITFETKDPAMNLEIVKGRGNVSPDEAIRYNDLVLDKARAQFQLSAAGVTPLQIDANNDGRFESTLEPSAHVVGAAAKDTRGPEIRFEVLERDATSVLVAIKATDKETGVKNLFYSIDMKHEFPYEGPVRVKLSESKSISGIADDNAGNRSVYTYQFEPIR